DIYLYTKDLLDKKKKINNLYIIVQLLTYLYKHSHSKEFISFKYFLSKILEIIKNELDNKQIYIFLIEQFEKEKKKNLRYKEKINFLKIIKNDFNDKDYIL